MVKYSDTTIKDLLSDDLKITWTYDNHKKVTVGVYELPIAFDIETTSTEINGDKFSFMYEWSIAINEKTCYGRTWQEFINFCQDLRLYLELSDVQRVIIYVHNLPFEFQFMREYIRWESVFAVDERKVIKAVSIYGIEFRDSYILSGYGLAKLADNLHSHTIKKLVGDLDYKLVRHSETPMTEKEMSYCENDVLIITAYIQEQIEQYKSISKIPLTNTGRVRQYVRNRCLQDNKRKGNKSNGKRYRDLMIECQLDIKSYSYARKAFQGGFVHGSLQYIGQLLKDVHSIDFNSSYPYAMCSEQYPMSRPYTMTDKDIVYSDDYLSVFRVIFFDLQSKFPFDSYLSKSKCKLENDISHNGRVYCADICETIITNIDLKIIKGCYTFGRIEILDGYYFYKQYLPKQIIESILDLYNDKTLLKGVKGKEVEYLLSKGMLNSVYGMSVTDIIRDEYIYENGAWNTNKMTLDEMEVALDKNNQSRNRFLYYPWGVFVTAYARYNLWTGGILRMSDDYVYSDTDSVKFLNYEKYTHWIDDYNKQCEIKLKKMCDFRHIDFERCKPKDRLLGVFDYEGKSDYFKTLGAKRYMTYNEKDGYKLTVAGLSKQNGIEYIKELGKGNIEKTFGIFDNNLSIPETRTGKQTHTYIDKEKEYDIIDYTGKMFHVKQLSGLHLSDCPFEMSISDAFVSFFGAFQQGYIVKRGITL